VRRLVIPLSALLLIGWQVTLVDASSELLANKSVSTTATTEDVDRESSDDDDDDKSGSSSTTSTSLNGTTSTTIRSEKRSDDGDDDDNDDDDSSQSSSSSSSSSVASTTTISGVGVRATVTSRTRNNKENSSSPTSTLAGSNSGQSKRTSPDDDFARLTVSTSGNFYEVRVISSYENTSFTIRAKAPGRQPIVWNITTGTAGQRKFVTTTNLSGHTVVLLLGDKRVDVARVS
jgi:hypothetical protein